MTGAEPSQAQQAFLLGHALATGRVSAAPDDQYESARGALQVAIGLGDPEWSPRSAYVLGELSQPAVGHRNQVPLVHAQAQVRQGMREAHGLPARGFR